MTLCKKCNEEKGEFIIRGLCPHCLKEERGMYEGTVIKNNGFEVGWEESEGYSKKKVGSEFGD